METPTRTIQTTPTIQKNIVLNNPRTILNGQTSKSSLFGINTLKLTPTTQNIPKSFLISKQQTKTATLSKTEVVSPTPIQTTPTRIITQVIATPPINTLTPIFPLPIFKFGFEQKQKPRALGFDVFVKTKGLFEKVNSKALNRKQAINFGSYVVDNTAQATFKIKPSESKTMGKFFGNSSINKFYNKTGGLFIENNKYRIDTKGEKEQITFKGLTALKFKRLVF
jgi:hypothetical protein